MVVRICHTILRGAGDPVVLQSIVPGRLCRLVCRVPDVLVVGNLVGRRAAVIRLQNVRFLIVLRVLPVLAIAPSLGFAGAGRSVRREHVGRLWDQLRGGGHHRGDGRQRRFDGKVGVEGLVGLRTQQRRVGIRRRVLLLVHRKKIFIN